MKIKICGIRRMEDVAYLNEFLPDYAGFIFAKTRREVTKEQAQKLRRELDAKIPVFGVFVNAPPEMAAELAEQEIINVIQLHGDEDEAYIRKLKEMTTVPVGKAVRAKDAETIQKADELPCDFLLLDTYFPNQYGGTGETFAWEMIPGNLKHPYLLAGGLNAENLPKAIQAVRGRGNCIGVDISGGVETDGCKDREKIEQIIRLVRNYSSQVE